MGGVVGWCWCGNRYIRIKGKWVNPTHLKKCHFLISHHAFSIVLGVSKNEQFQRWRGDERRRNTSRRDETTKGWCNMRMMDERWCNSQSARWEEERAVQQEDVAMIGVSTTSTGRHFEGKGEEMQWNDDVRHLGCDIWEGSKSKVWFLTSPVLNGERENSHPN